MRAVRGERIKRGVLCGIYEHGRESLSTDTLSDKRSVYAECVRLRVCIGVKPKKRSPAAPAIHYLAGV